MTLKCTQVLAGSNALCTDLFTPSETGFLSSCKLHELFLALCEGNTHNPCVYKPMGALPWLAHEQNKDCMTMSYHMDSRGMHIGVHESFLHNIHFNAHYNTDLICTHTHTHTHTPTPTHTHHTHTESHTSTEKHPLHAMLDYLAAVK